jgi:hypothetical protein
MTEGDRRRERLRQVDDELAAFTGQCPVCHRNTARMTVSVDDGSQEGICENCTPPSFLERGSEKKPWRVVEPESDTPGGGAAT